MTPRALSVLFTRWQELAQWSTITSLFFFLESGRTRCKSQSTFLFLFENGIGISGFEVQTLLVHFFWDSMLMNVGFYAAKATNAHSEI